MRISDWSSDVCSSDLDRVATISTEKSRAVKMNVGRNSLVLSASSPDSGTATEEIEVAYKEADIEIGFNSRYLLDIAQQIERSAERRVGQECVSTCRSRCSPCQ